MEYATLNASHVALHAPHQQLLQEHKNDNGPTTLAVKVVLDRVLMSCSR